VLANVYHERQALTQGSQFTSVAFTDVLKFAVIAISMDGKGAHGKLGTTQNQAGSHCPAVVLGAACFLRKSAQYT
jgi:hypothetical protein